MPTIYGDATSFEDYFLARKIAIPGTWDEDIINAALLVASEWIDGVYGPSFVGRKTGGFLQAREWPRTGAVVRSTGYWGQYYVFADTDIPDRLKNATYEAAFRQATTPGSLDVDFTPSKYRSVSISGAISVDYMPFSSSAEIQKQYGVIDKWIWPLLDPHSDSSTSGVSGSAGRV